MKWDRWLAALFLILGIAYASYSGIEYFQKIQVVSVMPTNQFEQVKNQGDQAIKEEVPWVIVPSEQRPKQGDHFANLIIPRLSAKMPVVEGTDEDELARGVGHYAGSVLPGEPDNVVLSGHRDTVFRQMGEMQKGDELQVETAHGTFVYVITKMWITKADDRTVIVPHKKPVLTLSTCYPFTFIGPAPKRYIIQAELKEKYLWKSE